MVTQHEPPPKNGCFSTELLLQVFTRQILFWNQPVLAKSTATLIEVASAADAIIIVSPLLLLCNVPSNGIVISVCTWVSHSGSIQRSTAAVPQPDVDCSASEGWTSSPFTSADVHVCSCAAAKQTLISTWMKKARAGSSFDGLIMLQTTHYKRMTETSKQPVLVQPVTVLNEWLLLLCNCKPRMCDNHDCLHNCRPSWPVYQRA